jgi:hypothetical protein
MLDVLLCQQPYGDHACHHANLAPVPKQNETKPFGCLASAGSVAFVGR